jgi:cell division protein FtsQ
MSRVKAAKPASPRSPRAALAAPRQAESAQKLPDRPGRWKLLLRRRRNLLRPLAGLAVLSVVGLTLIGAVHGFGQGLNFSERLGDLTGRMGLRVSTIEVLGRQKTPEPLLRAALGVNTGDPILTFSLSAARARIETIAWVQSATVERRLPGTIVVQLTERRPFAVWQQHGKFTLIDRKGQVVTDSDVAAFANQLPLVVGDGADQAAAALIDALAAQPDLQSRVVAAVRVGRRRWNLRMHNGMDVLLPEGADVPALARLAELQAKDELLDRPLEAIDMRQPDRLVLRPYPDKPTDAKAMPDAPPAPPPAPPRKT